MALNGPERPIVNAGGVDFVDPGNAGELNMLASGSYALVSAGAETRVLALPDHEGQRLVCTMDTDGGDIVVTLTGGGAGGESTLTFDDPGESVTLVGVSVGGALAWSVHPADTAPTIA